MREKDYFLLSNNVICGNSYKKSSLSFPARLCPPFPVPFLSPLPHLDKFKMTAEIKLQNDEITPVKRDKRLRRERTEGGEGGDERRGRGKEKGRGFQVLVRK